MARSPYPPVLDAIPVRGGYDASPSRLPAGATTGVLTPRLGAFLVDVTFVGLIWLLPALALLALGLLTFGLAWYLIIPLWTAVALVYNGLTIASPMMGTPGMRLMGLVMTTTEGGRVDVLTASVHALLYYVSTVFLTPLALLFGLFRADRRLLHDLVAGVLVRRG